jgi:hypothetical protein
MASAADSPRTRYTSGVLRWRDLTAMEEIR